MRIGDIHPSVMIFPIFSICTARSLQTRRHSYATLLGLGPLPTDSYDEHAMANRVASTAISAIIAFSGDAFIVMDVDLQDPPELVAPLWST